METTGRVTRSRAKAIGTPLADKTDSGVGKSAKSSRKSGVDLGRAAASALFRESRITQDDVDQDTSSAAPQSAELKFKGQSPVCGSVFEEAPASPQQQQHGASSPDAAEVLHNEASELCEAGAGFAFVPLDSEEAGQLAEAEEATAATPAAASCDTPMHVLFGWESIEALPEDEAVEADAAAFAALLGDEMMTDDEQAAPVVGAFAGPTSVFDGIDLQLQAAGLVRHGGSIITGAQELDEATLFLSASYSGAPAATHLYGTSATDTATTQLPASDAYAGQLQQPTPSLFGADMAIDHVGGDNTDVEPASAGPLTPSSAAAIDELHAPFDPRNEHHDVSGFHFDVEARRSSSSPVMLPACNTPASSPVGPVQAALPATPPPSPMDTYDEDDVMTASLNFQGLGIALPSPLPPLVALLESQTQAVSGGVTEVDGKDSSQQSGVPSAEVAALAVPTAAAVDMDTDMLVNAQQDLLSHPPLAAVAKLDEGAVAEAAATTLSGSAESTVAEAAAPLVPAAFESIRAAATAPRSVSGMALKAFMSPAARKAPAAAGAKAAPMTAAKPARPSPRRLTVTAARAGAAATTATPAAGTAATASASSVVKRLALGSMPAATQGSAAFRTPTGAAASAGTRRSPTTTSPRLSARASVSPQGTPAAAAAGAAVDADAEMTPAGMSGESLQARALNDRAAAFVAAPKPTDTPHPVSGRTLGAVAAPAAAVAAVPSAAAARNVTMPLPAAQADPAGAVTADGVLASQPAVSKRVSISTPHNNSGTRSKVGSESKSAASGKPFVRTPHPKSARSSSSSGGTSAVHRRHVSALVSSSPNAPLTPSQQAVQSEEVQEAATVATAPGFILLDSNEAFAEGDDDAAAVEARPAAAVPSLDAERTDDNVGAAAGRTDTPVHLSSSSQHSVPNALQVDCAGVAPLSPVPAAAAGDKEGDAFVGEREVVAAWGTPEFTTLSQQSRRGTAAKAKAAAVEVSPRPAFGQSASKQVQQRLQPHPMAAPKSQERSTTAAVRATAGATPSRYLLQTTASIHKAAAPSHATSAAGGGDCGTVPPAAVGAAVQRPSVYDPLRWSPPAKVTATVAAVKPMSSPAPPAKAAATVTAIKPMTSPNPPAKAAATVAGIKPWTSPTPVAKPVSASGTAPAVAIGGLGQAVAAVARGKAAAQAVAAAGDGAAVAVLAAPAASGGVGGMRSKGTSALSGRSTADTRNSVVPRLALQDRVRKVKALLTDVRHPRQVNKAAAARLPAAAMPSEDDGVAEAAFDQAAEDELVAAVTNGKMDVTSAAQQRRAPGQLRGVPMPQGQHTRFIDAGAAVPSPGRVVLRGVAPAAGSHKRWL